MNLFFFHVQDHLSQPDVEGTELSSLKEARFEAIRLAGSMMLNETEMFLGNEVWSLNVSDAEGLQLFSYTIFGLDSPAIR